MKRRNLAIIILMVSCIIISSMTGFSTKNDKNRKIIVFNPNINANQKEEVLKRHSGEELKT
ncbi:MAG: hypothetical protein CVU98_02140 [Firmicutes bacterium HGW-Firmicutes-3]|nr:MAG: hypothetical protein CVU98_02140 [Firmicutes bacterium HGW-Firmicutes-3]